MTTRKPPETPKQGSLLLLSEEKAKRRALSVFRENFIESAALIYGETASERGDLGFLHTLHANCYLPRGKTTARRHVHKSGKYSIMVEAGALCDPETGEWVEQPLPSGGKPRALLAYLNSYAVQHKTPEVPLGRSLTDFIREMSGIATGGSTGTIAYWKNQMMALAASTMRIAGEGGDTIRMSKVDIIKEMSLWFSPIPSQLSIFPSSVVLSTDYFENLQEHAMPIDLAALRALQGDPLAFDVYCWLSYRLPRIRQPEGALIPWPALYQQFGGEYALQRQFKARFLNALNTKVRVLYPAAKVEVTPSGLKLRVSPPLIERKTPVRVLNAIKAGQGRAPKSK